MKGTHEVAADFPPPSASASAEAKKALSVDPCDLRSKTSTAEFAVIKNNDSALFWIILIKIYIKFIGDDNNNRC